jgi:hypothetical protein
VHARGTCEDIGNVIIVTGYLENMGIDTSFVRLRSIVAELLHKVCMFLMRSCTIEVHASPRARARVSYKCTEMFVNMCSRNV